MSAPPAQAPAGAELPGWVPVADLPRAGGAPGARAVLRASAEDFEVEEELGYRPAGAGQHAWLRLRKRGANTLWVARHLAAFAGVPRRDVGFAGLKDRVALATQWFSVDLAGRGEPRWQELSLPGVEVLEVTRNRRKLRRGGLRGNRFVLVLRGLEDARGELPARLARIAREGVPNYFGAQRFGHGGTNLQGAARMLIGGQRVRERERRGLYCSAARALLFNRVLAHRVGERCWNRVVPGDVMMLDGTHSLFAAEPADAGLEERVARLQVHPSGPLCGRGEPRVQGPARALEQQALAGCEAWLAGLVRAGLEGARRALRVRVAELSWEASPGGCRLAFALPAGSYATVVLRELVEPRAPRPAPA